MERRHFEGLDALRGIAAAMVVAHHIGITVPGNPVTSHGYLAVDLFFMLSGIVIGLVYERRLVERRLGIVGYAGIRLIRLYPLILLGIAWGTVQELASGNAADHLPLHVVAQILMIPWLVPLLSTFPLNGPQWSLFFELAVNAFHALIARFLGMPLLVALIAVSAVGYGLAIARYGSSNVGWTRYGFMGGFPRVGFGFFLGILLFRLFRDGRLPAIFFPPRVALPMFPIVVVAASFVGSALADAIAVFLVLPLIAWGGLRLSLGDRGRRIATIAGRLSYPVYATHVPLLLTMSLLVGSGRASPKLLFATAGLVVLLLCLVAVLVERCYDRPVRAALSRRLTGRLERVGFSTAP